MRKAVLVLMVLSLLLVVGVQPVSASGKMIHVVKRGENLYRIALRYGTTVHAIAAANHIRNPNRIYVGQRLVIPHGKWHGGGGCHGFWYKVRWGDTLTSIGWRFGVSPWAIAHANHLWNPNCIFAGQKLWIPDC